ncbi:MAG: CoA pyrophosphatase [Myxococcales bacterium]|nr:CoA pyrophosphatase [Myxococcales bacterium]
MTPASLAALLASRPRRVLASEHLRPAAVLVALLAPPDLGALPRVLLTRRNATMREHAGQYAFPGGRRDPDDVDAVATALREAHEEVGLAPAAVRVLGLLDDLPTVTDYLVTPVLGWVAEAPVWRHNPSEVDLVVELPLSAFVGPRQPVTIAWRGGTREVQVYDVGPHRIWGATAAMLESLVTTLGL